jgi:hypothetical protein
MRHRATAGFWANYKALPVEVQRLADKQYDLLKRDPAHPSLRFKKIGDLRGRELWSARVTLGCRALAAKRGDAFVWFWIGNHKTYDKLIGSGH